MNKYKNKNILIIGLGKTGISCINFFKTKKSNIFAMDNNINLSVNNINLPKDHLSLGNFKISWILQSDLIILSPGISLNTPEILIAKLYNLDIVNDIEIFFRENIKSKIILITGSNGKSTVSTMIYKILKKSNYKAILVGNIGNPILNKIKYKYDFYVIELSSFQLEIIKSIKSYISIILNITDNHLDRHLNIKNYMNCKLNIYKNSLNCIFNYDNKLTWPLDIKKNVNFISFGLYNGNYHIIKNVDKKNIFIVKNNKIIDNFENLKIKNNCIANILAFIAITDLISNISNKNKLYIINNFKNLKYRLQIVKKKIIYVNDSKSTNIYSTILAVNYFKKYHYIHLILGGLVKSKNFKLLSNFIKYKNIIVYIFGKNRIFLSKYFDNLYICKEKLEDLIILIKNIYKKKDIILFSPSCSSLDQYKSFEQRGEFFIKFIKN